MRCMWTAFDSTMYKFKRNKARNSGFEGIGKYIHCLLNKSQQTVRVGQCMNHAIITVIRDCQRWQSLTKILFTFFSG